MKPLMYAYMVVTGDVLDGDVRQMEVTLRFVAEQEGFCFGTIFHEHETASRPALSELIRELQRAEARDVIMPTLRHLADNPMLRLTRIGLIEDAGARIHALSDYTRTCNG